MSRFLSKRLRGMQPYVPGEQPKDGSILIKLNTNESPFPPSEKAVAAVAEEGKNMRLYSDPSGTALKEKLSQVYGLDPACFVLANGSDEILDFAFQAFADDKHPAAFPDVTYGFYPVFARKYGIPYREIPLKDDFTVDPEDYMGTNETLFIANPNAPTGIALERRVLEMIIASNQDRVVVVDEAYVDFGGESCIELVNKFDNLLVTRTYSKSRSMAGARLGFGACCPELAKDLESVRNSTNPYNVNRMTLAAGAAALDDEAYTKACCEKIIAVRNETAKGLQNLGFTVLPSSANFLFVKSPEISGADLYAALRRRGILVRHFSLRRIEDFNRVTVGTADQMKIFLDNVKQILEETEK